MGVSQGKTSLALGDVLNSVSEPMLLAHYLGITTVPVVINSPLREDKNPSFGIYSPDGTRIKYKDFATGETGGIIDLLKQMWHCSFIEVLDKIVKDGNITKKTVVISPTKEHNNSTTYSGDTKLEVKVRDWKGYDMSFWNSFGIDKKLLNKANVYPISHYIITKKGKKMIFGADKFAYAYAEFKEGNTSIKVYQPFNKSSFKWISKHNRSVLGLWTLLPEKGVVVCICSSVKDALCLYANTGIPAICLQGEAYGISETAQGELKKRFKHVVILLDNDEPGIKDANRLAEQTGFINITLPKISGAKDIAELYTTIQEPNNFKKIIISLFKKSIDL